MASKLILYSKENSSQIFNLFSTSFIWKCNSRKITKKFHLNQEIFSGVTGEDVEAKMQKVEDEINSESYDFQKTLKQREIRKLRRS